MNKYRWYLIIFLILIAIAQPFMADWFSVRGVSINFLLFFVMLTAFGKKMPDALIVPFLMGFFYDMQYSPWLGRMALILLLAVLSVMAVSRFVYKENVPVLTLYFFISTYLLENIRVILEVGPGVFYRSFSFIQADILGISLYAAILAGVFGLIFYLRTLSFDKKLRARKSGSL